MSSPSKSFWSGLYVFSQLSSEFIIPSLSKSFERTSKLIPTDSIVWPEAVALIIIGYSFASASLEISNSNVISPSLLMFIGFDGEYVTSVLLGNPSKENVVSKS